MERPRGRPTLYRVRPHEKHLILLTHPAEHSLREAVPFVRSRGHLRLEVPLWNSSCCVIVSGTHQCVVWDVNPNQDYQLASNVNQAGLEVYGAFDGSWRPFLPLFEPNSLLVYRLLGLYLDYLYCEEYHD
jgi:hypothetical protein